MDTESALIQPNNRKQASFALSKIPASPAAFTGNGFSNGGEELKLSSRRQEYGNRSGILHSGLSNIGAEIPRVMSFQWHFLEAVGPRRKKTPDTIRPGLVGS